MLKIMGLGPGAYEALTIGALKELKNNDIIYIIIPTNTAIKQDILLLPLYFKACVYKYKTVPIIKSGINYEFNTYKIFKYLW